MLDLPKQYETVEVGLIPSGKFDVYVRLESDEDIDIALYDIEDTSKFREGTAVVAWCGTKGCNQGVLGMSGGLENATYQRPGIADMKIQYSGYNGEGGKLGHEFIRIFGETSAPLMMKAYAYQTGKAKVSYFWGPAKDPCCLGTEACKGTFQQDVASSGTIDVGEIPAGKKDVTINLKAAGGKDVDVQLFDLADKSEFDEGKAIIAWCGTRGCNKGLLNGPLFGTAEYQEVTYEYSGYNGISHKGDETISVVGVTNRPLMMKVFGFEAGIANVTYSYWNLPPASTEPAENTIPITLDDDLEIAAPTIGNELDGTNNVLSVAP